VRQLRTYPVHLLKDNLKTDNLTIHTDGAARGNPGPAAIGAVIADEKGNVVATISRCLGVTTNNQAEYRAIIAALEKAVSLGARHIAMYSDSELVVKQINGQYRIKHAALQPLYKEVVRLTGGLENFKISHVRREQNAGADALANQALDGVQQPDYPNKGYQ
jgi:ribonuclease HI